ncbi:MAG: protein-L-isoaspartate O-methyltransferase family protein [Hyphomicrobiaceae bacterium]
MDSAVQRKNMVDSQVRPSDVTDRRIARAMLAVPRETFVPQDRKAVAYMDDDLSLGGEAPLQGRALLAPRTLSKLLQGLAIPDDAVVLDIGGATGYSAAVLAQFCRKVVALESSDGMASVARDNLAALGLSNVEVVNGKLTSGYSDACPFDAILVGGRVSDILPGLLDQLKDGGRLAAIIDEDGVGKAYLWQRYGMSWDRRWLFDAEGPMLPGCAKKVEFEF